MSHKNLDFYIDLILLCIQKIETYTYEISLENFKENDITYDACITQFTNIGEILMRINKNFSDVKISNKREIIDFRNLITHDYFSVDQWYGK